MQDIHSGMHENDFTGTPYVPVYVKLPVSVLDLLLAEYLALIMFNFSILDNKL